MNTAEALNQNCHCTTLDTAALARNLDAMEGAASLSATLKARPHLFSSTAVFVSAAQIAEMQRIIQAVESVINLPGYRERALARTPEIARIDHGAHGVFLGYDFHLGPAGAQLIEINTNAGGGLLNKLLASAQADCCTVMRDLAKPPNHALEQIYFDMFTAEWRHVRGATASFVTVAIVDDDPTGQYLYPEFLLFANFFRRHGLEALIVDAAALEFHGGALWHGDVKIDLVYNRLTDFYLQEPRHAALRSAHKAGAVVLTPHPRAYALYADKRNLGLLSDADFLHEVGVEKETVECLTRGIPRTVAVDACRADELWDQRRALFFKPATGYAGKAAYRGDKLTRRVWSDILGANYVAQATVPPSARALQVNGDTRHFKLDVRAYVYDGAIQALAARLYQGQTTNFRTPGGGFAPVVVVSENPPVTDLGETSPISACINAK